MDFIQKILSEKGGELVQGLVSQLGFGQEQAQRFVPAAASRVIEQIQGGGFDLASLLGGGGVYDVVSKVDTASLARETGIDEAQATSGLQKLAPSLLNMLKDQAGGADGLLSMLGGDKAGGMLGGMGKLAGKLFK